MPPAEGPATPSGRVPGSRRGRRGRPRRGGRPRCRGALGWLGEGWRPV